MPLAASLTLLLMLVIIPPFLLALKCHHLAFATWGSYHPTDTRQHVLFSPEEKGRPLLNAQSSLADGDRTAQNNCQPDFPSLAARKTRVSHPQTVGYCLDITQAYFLSRLN